MSDAGRTLERYVIISADTHAGADLLEYRAYLDPAWRDEFDTWAASYVNPYAEFVEATAIRNWDSDFRLGELDEDGICGEVVFPNTVPPFYDTIQGFSSIPWTHEDFVRRLAGLRAHNRWLVEFCAKAPARRRGLLQLYPHDIDLAIEDMRWAKDTGVIGGVMLPPVPPNHAVQPYHHPRYDQLWAACQDLDLPVHQHSGSGGPEVGADTPAGPAITLTEMRIWTTRTLTHLMLAGVFERFPELKVVWTEQGAAWVLGELRKLDTMAASMRSDAPNRSAMLFGSETIDSLTKRPSEYFAHNCYLGASFLQRHEVPFLHDIGVDRIMWGTDYPHEEGTFPYSREALRATFFDVPVDECRAIFAGNAAALYGFDLDALAPLAARIGPTVDEIAVPLTEVPPSNSSAFGGFLSYEIMR